MWLACCGPWLDSLLSWRQISFEKTKLHLKQASFKSRRGFTAGCTRPSLWQSASDCSSVTMWSLSTFLCFYRRRNIRHYDTYTNSPHEGTNNGLKAGAAPVMPQHSLDRSASILNHNAQIKATSSSILSANAVSSKSLWSSLPTSQRLTHKGEGLVTQQWNLRNNYISQRVAEEHWLDSCLFLHALRTYWYPLSPSDAHPELLSNDYLGITHHDVCVTWWQEFLAYGFSNDPKCHNVSSLYKRLLFNDIRGPSIPNGIELPPIQPTLADTSLAVKPTKETCLNYDVSTINLALRRSNFSDVEPNGLFGCEEPTLTSNEDNDDFIGNPCNTQQETTLYSTNEDEDAALVFPELVPTVVRKESVPYSVLVPLAKELASILEETAQWRSCSSTRQCYQIALRRKSTK
ncbi:hypothetical protein MHU86_22547 [Fragilaria crotonensis]|nr:hypothetical protein MHU86_22547 [Fragilaria crotonensis]